ncbi:MAG: hypothetical protein QF516_08615, partial [Pirellulaceae bacterium]|nr:hypothetical protein [Pirellulaceae bacterium]
FRVTEMRGLKRRSGAPWFSLKNLLAARRVRPQVVSVESRDLVDVNLPPRMAAEKQLRERMSDWPVGASGPAVASWSFPERLVL